MICVKDLKVVEDFLVDKIGFAKLKADTYEVVIL